MNVKINKESVLDNVRMQASIVGRNYKDVDGKSLWDRVRIQDRDDDELELLWDAMYSEILRRMGNYVVSRTGDDVELAEGRRFNAAVISDLSEMIESILINGITAGWLRLKAVEYAGVYDNAVERGLENLMEKLRVKTEPTLKTYNKE